MLSHDAVIVGGGAPGLSGAASLLRRRPRLDVGIVEPATRMIICPALPWSAPAPSRPNNCSVRPRASSRKGATFGVPAYVPALQKTVERYGIDVHLGSNLIAVDGPVRTPAHKSEAGETVRDFDMLHVTPPQKGCMVVADSKLADAASYVEVHQETLRHERLPNVMARGDVGSMPNAKTAAA